MREYAPLILMEDEPVQGALSFPGMTDLWVFSQRHVT